MNRLLSLIGLSKKAGKIVWGFDMVKEAAQKKEVGFIFLACDLAERSKKEVRYFSEKCGCTVVECGFTMNEIEYMLSKRTGIIAIADQGLAEKAYHLATSKC